MRRLSRKISWRYLFSKKSHIAFNSISIVSVFGVAITTLALICTLSVYIGFTELIGSLYSQIDPQIKITPQQGKTIDTNDRAIEQIAEWPEIEVCSPVIEENALCLYKERQRPVLVKGVPDNYDLSFLSSCLTAGKSDIRSHGVLISQSTADKLNIRTGERIDIYFMNEQKIKMRRCTVNGIFNTDFDDYDAYVMVGNLEVLQSVNRWPENTASYIEVKCNSMDDIDLVCSHLIDEIDKEAADYTSTLSGIFQISTIRDNNPTHFAWLDLLNTNIVVILILMMCVACFSIIACLIIVVLNKISTIGILKALGATNRNIRHIFIIIVMKIIVRAMVVGNGIALLLLLLQRHFHLIELDAKSYFMHYVPVEIGYWIVPLNLGILIVSFLALLVPSFIIASIKPAKTIRFE